MGGFLRRYLQPGRGVGCLFWDRLSFTWEPAGAVWLPGTPELGFQREIHNIENTPFRTTKFDRTVGEMVGQVLYWQHQRHGPTASAGPARSTEPTPSAWWGSSKMKIS